MPILRATLVLLAACGGATASTPTTTPAIEAPQVPEGWRRPTASALVTSFGPPAHVASDALTTVARAVTVHGKFAYGLVSKDLQGEDVTAHAWVDGAWSPLGAAVTDRDGRAAIDVPAGSVALSEGAHRIRFTVHGDRSSAEATLWVVPAGAAVAVFDVDGTLTEDDLELVEEIATGESPTPHPGAAEVVRHHAAAGALPVYVTARVYLLEPATRAWLEREGFPAGPLFTTRSLREARAEDDAGAHAFKLALLRDLAGRLGLEVRCAYGNAPTDICAYAEAGVPPERTFIVGEHAGEACAPHPAPVGVEDYPSHLTALCAASPGACVTP